MGTAPLFCCVIYPAFPVKTVFRITSLSSLVESTRIARALGTYRGLAPADRTPIAQMLCRLSVLAALIPAIRDLTINPLVWTDGGAAAIDADVNLNEAPVESEPGYPHPTVCAPPWEEGREVAFGGEALTPRTFVQSDFHLRSRRFLGRLSEKTFYLRFTRPSTSPTSASASSPRLTTPARPPGRSPSDGEIHAVARWRLTGELGEAEFGIVVEDAWQPPRPCTRAHGAHRDHGVRTRRHPTCRPRPQGQRGHAGHDDGHVGYTLGEGDSRDTR